MKPMKKFSVVLSKSYVVNISATTEMQARQFAEFYTGDIKDISSEKDRVEQNFVIGEIECGINESLNVEEVSGD